MNFIELLEKTIEDYLDKKDFSYIIESCNYDEAFGEQEILQFIDSRELANYIFSKIEVAEFDSSNYAKQVCSSCGKPFGDFKFENGVKISSEKVLTEGQKVVIL